MTLITSIGGDEDFDDADSKTCTFLGSCLDDLMDEASAVSLFGVDYRNTLIRAPVMRAIIRPLFIAPARPLGIRFPPFDIDPECLGYITMNNEILEDISGLSERFKWYCEVDGDTPEEWLVTELDEAIILRHIPLLPTHTGVVYFHAHHLDTFLHYAFRIKDGYQIFGRDMCKRPTSYGAYEF